MRNKLKILNNVCFFISIVIIVFLMAASYSYIGDFSFISKFLVIVLMAFSSIKIIEIVRKEDIIYDTKYNILLLVCNIATLFSGIYTGIYLNYCNGAPIDYKSDIFILCFSYLILFLYNLLNIKSYKNLFKNKIILKLIINVVFLLELITILSSNFSTIISIIIFIIFILYYLYLIKKKNNIFNSLKYNLLLICIIILCYLNQDINVNNDYLYSLCIGLKYSLHITLIFAFIMCHVDNFINNKKINKIINIITVLIAVSIIICGTLNSRNKINLIKEEQINLLEKLKTNNKYGRDYEFENYKISYDLEIDNDTELKNLYYTFMNSGTNEIIIKCNSGRCPYSDVLLEEFNNYVSPFNNIYSSEIKSLESNYYKISKIRFSDSYTEEEKNKIEDEINKIYNNLYNSSLSHVENIRRFHDYLIDNVMYCDYNNKTLLSILFDGKSTSAGYNEVMMLFLDKMNIPNMQIVTYQAIEQLNFRKHIWLLVYVENEWKHLDVAWDDPDNNYYNVVNRYDYFLIDNETLSKYKSVFHKFDGSVYSELSK